MEDVKHLHDRLLEEFGGTPGVLKPGGLEAAVLAPQATFAGQPLLTTLADVAAAYAFYLVTSHCFSDGNKRTSLAAALVFLDLNGHPLEPLGEEWAEVMVSAACGKISREQLAEAFAEALGSWIELS